MSRLVLTYDNESHVACLSFSLLLLLFRAKSTWPRRHSRLLASSSSSSRSNVITPINVENEPTLGYLEGSQELSELESALRELSEQVTDVPIIIGGRSLSSEHVVHQVCPFDHAKKVAKFYYASSDQISLAIKVSQQVHTEWDKVPLSEKISLFLRAAHLVSGKYRMMLNAATILGQGKTFIQAEIDSAAELADFFRFNAKFAADLTQYEPLSPAPTETINSMRYRSLEGFVASISPFNFTAIGGNLASAPTMMGNVVLWKPSDTAILSNYLIYKLLEEAGFPPGVINFVPSDGPTFGDTVTSSPHLSAINFTGSVATFKHLWKQTSLKLDGYKSFPRLIGECGGKNYHFVHPSADVLSVVNGTVRSAFEYSGQKCSACSRVYVAASLWPQVKEGLVETVKSLKLASPLERDTFLSAVIDEKSFTRISQFLKHAKSNCEIIAGGNADMSTGYFVEPTVVRVNDAHDRLMTEEIFGPIVAVFVYDDSQVDETLQLVNTTSPYALTGAIFANDEQFISKATQVLKYSCGNFYINDKSTGSVVGQQPFGGSRMSGTNDKAGGPHYLLKWASPQTIKQTFTPLTQVKYPYMM